MSTFRELKEELSTLSEQELDQEVYFFEPYDDGRAFKCELFVAEDDMKNRWGDDARDVGDAPEVVVKADMPYLG